MTIETHDQPQRSPAALVVRAPVSSGQSDARGFGADEPIVRQSYLVASVCVEDVGREVMEPCMQ